MEMAWSDEDVAYIGSRSARRPRALDLELGWVKEALSDPRLLEITPYPRSRVGASAFIGYSTAAERVLLVMPTRTSTATGTA